MLPWHRSLCWKDWNLPQVTDLALAILLLNADINVKDKERKLRYKKAEHLMQCKGFWKDCRWAIIQQVCYSSFCCAKQLWVMCCKLSPLTSPLIRMLGYWSQVTLQHFSCCPSNPPVPFMLMGGERLCESKDVLSRSTSPVLLASAGM